MSRRICAEASFCCYLQYFRGFRRKLGLTCLGGSFEVSREPFGRLLGALWESFGVSWGFLGVPWGTFWCPLGCLGSPLGRLWCTLGVPWDLLASLGVACWLPGVSLGRPGVSWGCPGDLLAASCARVSWKFKGVPRNPRESWGILGNPWGSWGSHGESQGILRNVRES